MGSNLLYRKKKWKLNKKNAQAKKNNKTNHKTKQSQKRDRTAAEMTC